MPTLFWGFLVIVVVVLGLALLALRPQVRGPERRSEATGDSSGGLWWATDAGSGDCGVGGCD